MGGMGLKARRSKPLELLSGMLSNYESSEEEKIKMVKKINNSFSNLNFQIDKLTEKQEITPEL